MKLLLVAATEPEISPFIRHIAQNWKSPVANIYTNGNSEIHICLTGVGLVATTYAVTKALKIGQYDFVLQAGVGGSFDRSIELGQLVMVQSEEFGDLGAEDRNNYLDIFDMGLLQPNEHPFTDGKLDTPLHEIPFPFKLLTVSGLSINTVSGRESTIALRNQRFGAQVESMEGAALHYVCLQENIPFAQIRAISNYVEPRDKSKWKMKEAIIALNKWLIDFSSTL
ncbi:futalosine hydrolase [Taibaiella soli]|uniref:Futalosine hydrolase n=1 Tax=Taibaiella soli TaxID=1649169 RepID=A0A2W2BFG2_9BACT|nr:futalosine hydrolase [Taibaiella soli]PZF72196.1 futalosine hydrolase [Taibaiella soli]